LGAFAKCNAANDLTQSLLAAGQYPDLSFIDSLNLEQFSGLEFVG
jgi:hypothetical protein